MYRKGTRLLLGCANCVFYCSYSTFFSLLLLTGHPRDQLERPEHPDGPEGPQVDAAGLLHLPRRHRRVLRGHEGDVPGRRGGDWAGGTRTEKNMTLRLTTASSFRYPDPSAACGGDERRETRVALFKKLPPCKLSA